MTPHLFMLTGVVLAGAAGDVCVARAMKRVGELSDFGLSTIIHFGINAGLNGFLWMGILWKAVAFFCLLSLLENAELSWVIPATAVSFVVELFAAKIFLHERVNFTRWAGALFIGVGVALISF